MIRDSCFHCRSDAERFVNAAEIVVGEPQRDRCPVVLPFLAERIRKAGEPANAHPRAEIGPLDYYRVLSAPSRGQKIQDDVEVVGGQLYRAAQLGDVPVP